ncbi:hypothetical protein HMPREF2751_07820 [Corynebacterium sp. HMSC063G05]|nr:hypothetical protein HMPREF2788_03550 [Corynebacterium sp. HMSC063F04]OFL73097.1 hypothetical protein HMPREF2751_07820 [Corynebacterium sp. HMSC063G05]OFN38824.1 hypothetical protein HMPREF2562_08260 [Corynebacterium sp. HMSC077G07]OHR37457.1 hypothetical protein HMPREF2920_06530 [Corynebacterium sp. HMSC075F02]
MFLLDQLLRPIDSRIAERLADKPIELIPRPTHDRGTDDAGTAYARRPIRHTPHPGKTLAGL